MGIIHDGLENECTKKRKSKNPVVNITYKIGYVTEEQKAIRIHARIMLLKIYTCMLFFTFTPQV